LGHIHYLTDISELAKAEAEREEALQLLSHDMRAPQSAIIAMLPALPDAQTRSRIERHARRTIQLAQDFVDIARMGETHFDGVDILFGDLVKDVADSLWPLAQERQVRIRVQDDTDGGFIFGEPDGLSRAVSNLFDKWLVTEKELPTVNDIMHMAKPREYHKALPAPRNEEVSREGLAKINQVVADSVKPKKDMKAWAKRILATPKNYPDIAIRFAKEALEIKDEVTA
jgi:hypothetical protein